MSADPVALARIARDPVTVDECEHAVESPTHGAVVTFAGIVRDHDEGRGVLRLSYEAHPEARGGHLHVGDGVASQIGGRLPQGRARRHPRHLGELERPALLVAPR